MTIYHKHIPQTYITHSYYINKSQFMYPRKV